MFPSSWVLKLVKTDPSVGECLLFETKDGEPGEAVRLRQD